MAGAKGRSGGQRSGAGRRAANTVLAVVRGTGSRGVMRPVISSPDVAMPALEPAVAAVWAELAPLATKAGTLVTTTVPAFVRLCQMVVNHAKFQAQIDKDGLTYLKVTIDGSGQEHTEVKAHPLLTRAQTLDNAVRATMKDFAINPFGKPLAEAFPKPVDPFAEFEETA